MIESLRLQRFKNFRDAVLPLGPLTVIVGTNAAGKSNLRDAFRFVHGMSRGYSLAEIIGEKYVEGGVLQWKGIRGGIREAAMYDNHSFSLTTTLKLPIVSSNDRLQVGLQNETVWNPVHRIEVDVSNLQHGPFVVEERFSDNYDVIFEADSSHESPRGGAAGSPLSVQLRLAAAYGGHIHELQLPNSVPVIVQLLSEKRILPAYANPARFFLDQLQSMHQLQSMRFLDLSPDAMRLPSIPGQTVLGDRGENLSSVLHAICTDESLKHAMAEWIRELTPIDVVDFEFIPDQTGRILVSLVESNGQRTSAYSASDGTLRFLAMIAALLGPDSAKFYFLEEIDNGIHPTRLGLLLQLIEQQTGRGKVQIVATTHSPQLLAILSPEARESAVLVYRLAHQSEAHIQRIMDIPSVREVLEQQNLSRLHESGWLENVMAYSQPEEAGV